MTFGHNIIHISLLRSVECSRGGPVRFKVSYQALNRVSFSPHDSADGGMVASKGATPPATGNSTFPVCTFVVFSM